MLRTLKFAHTVKNCHLVFRRNAGHSKWQNIKHIKAEKDGEKAAIFSKLRRLMEVSVQEGKSADPSVNIALSHAIEQAKKANMPSTTLNNFLESLKKARASSGDVKTLEISGPAGSAFVICIESYNLVSFKTNINTILRKSKGSFTIGTIAHLFSCKSVIKTYLPDNSTLEDAVNVAINLEMEDVVQVNENEVSLLQFIGEPSLIHKLKTQLESQNYKICSAEVNYSPLVQVVLGKDDMDLVNWLYQKLEDLPDIVNIFDNIVWPENS